MMLKSCWYIDIHFLYSAPALHCMLGYVIVFFIVEFGGIFPKALPTKPLD